MRAYAEAYLSEVVESQGKLFDFYAQKFPEKDTEDFIQIYMNIIIAYLGQKSII